MMNMEVMSVHSETDDPNGEGVWSPEIEQAFQEALKLFPPCGRRKHILQEEGGGKMYGRNELIARYIEQKTGHRRTRKQVSSHIQVLSRREARSKASSRGGDTDSVSPASSITASSLGGSSSPSNNVNMAPVGMSLADHRGQPRANSYCDVWADRPIVTAKIRLVEFSAFIEHWHPASSSSLEPITDLVLAANANNGHQAMNSTGSQQGLPMQIDSNGQQPRTPLMANNHLTQTGQTPHHLTAGSNQFNHSLQSINAIYTNPYQTLQQSNGQQTPLNYNQQHYQQMNQRNAEANNLMLSATANPMMLNYPHRTMASNTSNGVTRHSYVKIDYRMPVQRHFSKLERIDISQIQDKFPDIGGPKGLYQGSDPDAFFLIKFWADMKNDLEYNNADQRAYVGSSCHFETIEPLKSIICCTKACSYGLQVVEKVEKLYGSFNSTNGRYSYDIDRSELCEFMTQFIKKLRQLPLVSQMNSVLENFTVLQVVTNEATAEILLCLAFVFEIDDQSNGSQYHVYKLTKD